MSQPEDAGANQPGVEGQPAAATNISILDLLRHRSLMEEIRRVLDGLKMPPDSGEYLYAKQQIIRVWAPVIGVTLPVFLTIFLAIFGGQKVTMEDRSVEVTVIKEVEVKMDDIKPIKQEDVKPPEPQDIPEDMITTTDAPGPAGPGADPGSVVGPGSGPGTADPFSPKPAEFDSVAIVRSPIVFKGVYGSRNPGARGSLSGGGGGGGGSGTEGAVLRALRWLKKEQASDGSWEKTKPAMVGLALLTYLAHGETPASEEFGTTVERAIKWLVDNQTADGRFNGQDGNGYSLPIAAYALSEAYGMTKVPMLKTAAEKSINIIVYGQHASGGWNYNCNAENRDDTSYMGWCAQAVKAAYLAGLATPGLQDCMKKAVGGFKKNAAPSGGFGYCGPGEGGLTGVGVLCMQLMGAAREPECRNGMKWLENATYDWNQPWLANPIYYWYYVTQAKFHAGGETWAGWNKKFSLALVKNQKIIKEAIANPKGKMVDVGYWEPPNGVKGHTDGVVQDTTLCALQLEVYYRYLPTFKAPEEKKEEADAAASTAVDVKISM